MVKNIKKRNFIRLLICITLCLTVVYVQILNSSNILNENENFSFYNESLFLAQGSDDDTTKPVITIVQPCCNNTTITRTQYRIIANVSDANPPVYGNVLLQLFNQTDFLFNASMIYDSDNQWSFNWDNISLYPNYNTYIIKVWAKDSSPNENYSWSEEFYIFITISNAPSFLGFLLYILIFGFIIAGVIVYLNTRIYRKSSKHNE